MADISQNLNNKRSFESDRQDPEQNLEKRQNLDENFESDNASEKKTITNIYYDCLERIFDFLDLESLLMVAQTCKRLQIAANAKLGDKTVFIKPLQSTNNLQPPSILSLSSKSIAVYDWKFCFPFLRCFGSKIKELNVSFYNDRNIMRIDHFYRYIHQYCAENLNLLSIISNRAFSIKNHQCKPFENVQNLHLFSVGIQDELPEYVDYFPKLCRLVLYCTAINGNATDVLFPYVTYLSLSVNNNNGSTYSKVGIANLLHANPQIQSLNIRTESLTFDEIMDMISNITFIKELSLDVGWKFTDVDVIKLNRFEKLYLNSMDCDYTADEAMALIQQLNSIQYFSFYVQNHTECDRLLRQLDNNKWKHHHYQLTFRRAYSMTLSRRI